jgi:hypothetical protein
MYEPALRWPTEERSSIEEGIHAVGMKPEKETCRDAEEVNFQIQRSARWLSSIECEAVKSTDERVDDSDMDHKRIAGFAENP